MTSRGPRPPSRGRGPSWRGLRWATAVIALTLVATACGGAEESDSSATGEGNGAAGGQDGEPVDLTVWIAREYDVPADQFQGLEEQGLNITWDVQPDDDILQQLQRMRDAGEDLPDVIHDDTFLTPTYNELGFLLPINDLVAQFEEEDPDLYNLIDSDVWEQGSLGDEILGMPMAANFDILYYNAPWFEEAGVQAPIDSYDGVLEAARALKEARPDDVPLAVQALAGEGVNAQISMMAAAGIEFVDAVPQLDTEAGHYALDWFLTMSREGLLPPEAIAWGEDEARGSFIAGRSAMIIDGLNSAADYTDTPDFDFPDDWGTMLLPRSRSGGTEDGDYLSAARSWMVVADTEHPYEASLVLRYIAQSDNLTSAVLQGAPPPRQTEALNSDEVAEFMPFFSEDQRTAFLDSIAFPAAPNFGEIEDILEQMFGEIVQGATDESGEELARRYQAELDALSQ